MRDDQSEIRLAICGAKHSGKSGKRFNIFDLKNDFGTNLCIFS